LNESGTIDLVTALARLLSDPVLRRDFARDRETLATELKIRPSDRPVFLQLVSEHLEFQAALLLRKRFEPIQHLIPATLSTLPESGWPLFRQYATTGTGKASASRDALDFLIFLRTSGLPINRVELAHIELLQSAARFTLRLTHGPVRTRSTGSHSSPSRKSRRPLLSLHLRAHFWGRLHLWRIDLGL
jgi:hypothetical protein